MKRMIALAMLTASVAVAPTAHADQEQQYLDELAQSGVRGVQGHTALRGGHVVCDNLRLGMTPEDIINKISLFNRPFAPTIVASAQRHLCRDTLAGGGS